MAVLLEGNPFFISGGTLPLGAESYVERAADKQVLNALLNGHFCYVLNSRQMGKSSLSVRTMAKLRGAGHRTVFIDLTRIGGKNVNPEQWYAGLLAEVGRSLSVRPQILSYWKENSDLSPMQRFFGAIRDVALEESQEPLVIFIDEVDATKSVPFSTDEFFAGIRECFNRRVNDAEYKRLTFCLLGVALPSELIRDVQTTPFNIGERITLTDFSEDEIQVLSKGLGPNGAAVIKRVHHWTNGHPYLTQSLCASLASTAVPTVGDVDNAVQRIFLEPRARETNINLADVGNRVLNSYEHEEEAEKYRAEILTLYERILAGKPVLDDEANRNVGILKLSGLVRLDGRHLKVRNRINEHVFNRDWVHENMPFGEVRRQKAAFARGALRVASIAAALLLVVSSLALAAIREAQKADIASKEAQKQTGVAQAQRKVAESESQKADEARTAAENAAQELRKANLQLELKGEDLRKQTRLALIAGTKAQTSARVAEERARELKKIAELLKSQKEIADTAAEKARLAGEDANYLREKEIEQRKRVGDLLYATYLNLASNEFDNGNAGRVESLLLEQLPSVIEDEPDRRGFDWRYQWTRLTEGAIATPFLKDPQNLAFTPDGKVIGMNDKGIPVSANGDPTPGVKTSGPNSSPVTTVVTSADGSRYAVGRLNRTIELVSRDASQPKLLFKLGNLIPLRVLLSANGQRMVVETRQGCLVFDTSRPQQPIQTINSGGLPVLSPDGKRLALLNGPNNGGVDIFDLETGKQAEGARIGMQSTLRAGAFSTTGQHIAISASQGDFEVWNVDSRERRGRVSTGHRTAITAIAISPNGQQLATAAADGSIRVWDFGATINDADSQAPVEPVRTLVGHTKQVMTLRWAPTGTKLASMDVTGELRVWDLTNRPPAYIEPAFDVTFSKVKDLAAVSTENGRISIFNVKTGVRLNVFEGGASFWTCALSPDGDRLLISNGTGIRIYDVESRELKGTITPLENPRNDDVPQSAAFSPNGKFLAIAYGPRLWTDGTKGYGIIRVFDAKTYKEIARPAGHEAPVERVVFSPNSKYMLSASEDGTARLWSTNDFRQTGFTTLPGTVKSVAFAPDSKKAAAGNSRGVVVTFEVPSAKVQSRIEAHSDEITSLDFAPDGKTMLTGSKDRLLKLWDRESDISTLTMGGFRQELYGAGFSTDGSTIVASPDTQNGWYRAMDLKQAQQWIDHKRSIRPRSAPLLLRNALGKATVSHKNVFVLITEPVLSRYDQYMRSLVLASELKDIFSKHYEIVSLSGFSPGHDEGVHELTQQYFGVQMGTPCFFVLDPTGYAIADSKTEIDGELRNVGFPIQKWEVDHFIEVIKATSNATPSELERIRRFLLVDSGGS